MLFEIVRVASVLTSLALVVVGFLVAKGYSGALFRHRRNGVFYVAVAVVLGFGAAAVNALWWGVLHGVVTAYYGVVAIETFTQVGKAVDVVVKGLSVIAAVAALRALHANLPARERSDWTWVSVAFYPRGSWLCRRLFRPED